MTPLSISNAKIGSRVRLADNEFDEDYIDGSISEVHDQCIVIEWDIGTTTTWKPGDHALQCLSRDELLQQYANLKRARITTSITIARLEQLIAGEQEAA